MKPAHFAYLRARSVHEALDALAGSGGEGRILAGGQSLVAMMNMRLVRPRLLVDIGGIPELRRISADGAFVEIGASATQAACLASTDLRRLVPLLARALPYVGHYQTRSRGTVCGSVAHADPSAEIPLILRLLDGSVRLRSRRGAREVRAERFFTGGLVTARADDEMVTAVRFPAARPGCGFSFREFALRHGDFAIVAAAAAVWRDTRSGGVVAKLGLAGVADVPIVVDVSDPVNAGRVAAAAAVARNAFAGRDDLHASGPYRTHLAGLLAQEALGEAMAEAGVMPDG